MDPEFVQLADMIGQFGIWGIVIYKLIEVLKDAMFLGTFLFIIWKGVPWLVKILTDLD